MPEQKQDILTQSLLKLENELNTFGTIQSSLKEAHEKLEHAKKEWDTLTKEQQQSALRLVGATQSAIDTTNQVTVQAESITKALIPLAKAIENVNFPLRLDKIDMAVSTQASTMGTFQRTLETGIGDLRAEMVEAKKQGKLILILLVINIAFIAGLAYMVLKK